MDLLCSGHRPEARAGDAQVHRFEAGDLGCSSGLPEEFRRRIDAIPVGSILEVRTRDPSAREDLPALARLLGHKVLSVEASSGGTSEIRFRREH